MFEKSVKGGSNYNNRNIHQDHENSDNFNEMCGESRRIFFQLLNIYRTNKNEENRINMIHPRTTYKNELRKYRIKKDKRKTSKLIDARLKNAKLYWKMLKESVTPNKPDKKLNADTFAQYFKAINNPTDPFFQADEDILDFNEHHFESEIHVMFN